MKITKVKTMVGEAQGLAAVEMEKIVERKDCGAYALRNHEKNG